MTMPLDHLTKLRSRAELANPQADQPGTLTDEQRAKNAQAIVDAGRRRRGELAYPEDDISPTAKAILAAGRARRNEEE